MRVLLDECVDRRLAGDIQGHDVKTVPDIGWAALKNGELLARAEHEFDAFVTVDRGLPFQQDLSRFSIAVIVLRAPSNRLTHLRGLLPQLLAALPVAKRDSSPCASVGRIDSSGMPTGAERLSPSTPGRDISPTLLRKIARDIGITVEELLDRR